MNIVCDESKEVGPVELPLNVSDGLTNTWMSHQTMVMIRVKDVKPDVLVVVNIYRPLVQKVSPSWDRDHASPDISEELDDRSQAM